MLRMQGTVREIAVDVVRKDGTRLPVLVNARLDRDDHGEPLVVRIAVFDATERRTYERELLRAKESAEASEERARTLARTLQQTLIPPTPPTIPALDVAAAYRPAGDGSEVGGDFYDVFPVGADDWGIVLGDVCGKGAEAAVVTALVRYTVRALAVAMDRPSELLTQLNEVVRQHGTDRFCTVALARLRRQGDEWSATLGIGGHPAPVLVRRGEPPVQVDLQGSLVGVLSAPVFGDRQLRLLPGDVLLFYTDGVTEARRGRDFYGDERLLSAAARDGSAAALVESLVREVVDFQAGRPRDDIAVLAVGVPET
jgi:sigma-B regulation protein RsbU (phosphoserine phosphatase)